MKEFEITRKIPTNNSKSAESECKSMCWFKNNLYYPSIGPKYKRVALLIRKIQRNNELGPLLSRKLKGYNELPPYQEEELCFQGS